jgi:hypothetical protein
MGFMGGGLTPGGKAVPVLRQLNVEDFSEGQLSVQSLAKEKVPELWFSVSVKDAVRPWESGLPTPLSTARSQKHAV